MTPLVAARRSVVRLFGGHRLTRFKLILEAKLAADRYLIRRLGAGVHEINGYLFHLRNPEVGLAVDGITEPLLTEYVKRLIKPGMTVLDVGGHIGYFTVLFADLAAKTGQVVVFEPEPSNCTQIQLNLRLNNLTAIVVPKAVSDKTGATNLYLSTTNSGGHALHGQVSDSPLYAAASQHETIEVETVTVDDWLASSGITQVDFVKIDIEGWEYFALKGMKKTLEQNPTVQVAMEYAPSLLSSIGLDPAKPFEPLVELGFHFYEVGRTLELTTPKRLCESYGNRTYGVELLCTRQPPT